MPRSTSGADMIGLNFYRAESALRRRSNARAKSARRSACARQVVGVFVNAARDLHRRIACDALRLDLLQFHGDEPDDALAGWPVPVIRALRLKTGEQSAELRASRIADYILLDTFHPGAVTAAPAQTRPLIGLRGVDLRRVFISGGLTPDNVAEAAALAPYAVDVASGVESAPGIKDHDKLRSFIRQCKVCPIATATSASSAAVRRRDADAGAGRTGKGLQGGAARSRSSATSWNVARASIVGRPTPLYHRANLTARLGGAKIYLKREDLCHTGAHKINNALGQALLAGRMGKTRIIAETGAGQHGVATATMAALFRTRMRSLHGLASTSSASRSTCSA